MKKTIAILLILALVPLFSACGHKDAAAPTETPAPIETVSPDGSDQPAATGLPSDDLASGEDLTDFGDFTLPDAADPLDDSYKTGDADPAAAEIDPFDGATAATPAPTTASVTVAEVKIKDYVLADYTNDDLKISMQYPSHWSVEPGTNTVSFTEPAATGVPMRLSVTVKDFTGDKLDAEASKKEFTSFMKVVKEGYDNFKMSGKSNKLVFMNRGSLSSNYTAKFNGEKIKGFVIMCSVVKEKKIYALHFYAPQKRFKSAGAFFKKILYSVKPTVS